MPECRLLNPALSVVVKLQTVDEGLAKDVGMVKGVVGDKEVQVDDVPRGNESYNKMGNNNNN